MILVCSGQVHCVALRVSAVIPPSTLPQNMCRPAEIWYCLATTDEWITFTHPRMLSTCCMFDLLCGFIVQLLTKAAEQATALGAIAIVFALLEVSE